VTLLTLARGILRRLRQTEWQAASDIDPECIDLCRAMNALPGITTTQSCWGHGRSSYDVFFAADNLGYLPALLYWFESCHCGFGGWQVTVATDCAMRPAYFCVEGPTGQIAYQQSKDIAQLIEQYVRQERKE
jgi:hypothetical protein